MTNVLIKSELVPLMVDISSIMPQTTMTDEQFYAFCCEPELPDFILQMAKIW